MRLIGGFSTDDRGEAPASLARAMTRAVDRAAEPVSVLDRGMALFSTGHLGSFGRADRCWAVGDLALTNVPELQAETRTSALEELLPSLYAVYGSGFVNGLRGGFAFGLWDPEHDRLMLAVDRFGIKRLYYTETVGGVAFGTRPSMLQALPGLAGPVDPSAVYHYLNFGFVPAPSCIFGGIHRLPPGHMLVVERGMGVVTRYWDLVYRERPIGRADGARETFLMVEDAVRVCLGGIPAKETGAFLSGGTDSSTVLGLMTRSTGEPANAFSIDFSESRYSERRYAELAARHFGAVHHVHTLTAGEALKILPRLVAAYDEPFGNDSALAAYACAKLAQAHGMTRMLAGDGGDELFGGNERYRTDRIFAAYGLIPRGLRERVLEPLLSRVPEDARGPLGRARRYTRRANIPNPRRFYFSQFFFARHAQAFLAPEFLQTVDLDAPARAVEAHFDGAAADSELNRLLYVDLKLTIGDNDLYKVTRTAELAGVEVEFPMLDHRLAEFTATLPAHYKVRRLEKRYLFKRAFRGLLPAEILAKRKHGFGVPVSDWLRSHQGFRELVRDVVLAPTAHVRQYFRTDGLERLADLHRADRTAYYGSLLWVVLMLELWHREQANRGGGA